MGPPGYGARVEGIPAVEAALAAGRVRNLSIARRSASSARLSALVMSARQRGVGVRLVDSLEPIARTASPQGVAADCEPIRPVSLSDLAQETRPAAMVVIDHISDPRNLGAIARSAVAAGIPRLVIPQRRGAPLTATAFTAAAGALEATRVSLVSSIADTLRRLSGMGIWSVGLTAAARDSVFGLDLLAEPTALVVGGEHRGLTRLVAERVDLLASIPMIGETESLNASVAAALALFEMARIREHFATT